MIDLHTHSLLSDGELLPSELARRAKVKGYKIIGISDHVDGTNIESVASSILRLTKRPGAYDDIVILPGVELTHVPPTLIKDMIKEARRLGIYYVVVHGETIAEPVEEGTNRQAIEGGADILAHPGLICEEDMALATLNSVLIEISARKGHSLTNGHVAAVARKTGARLILDTDSHSPSDLITDEEGMRIVRGAGLTAEDFYILQNNAEDMVRRVIKR